MLKKIYFIFFSFLFCVQANCAKAEIWQTLKNNITSTFNAQSYDVYIPLYAWHNRLTYDKKHIKKYNENPWGAGLGKSFTDGQQNWHGLYAMAFKDSNHHPQTMFGYAFMLNKQISDFRCGIGFTLGLTQREEYKYLPIPLPLPLAGIGYQNLDIQAAYVPGWKNNGNVLFVYSKIKLN